MKDLAETKKPKIILGGLFLVGFLAIFLAITFMYSLYTTMFTDSSENTWSFGQMTSAENVKETILLIAVSVLTLVGWQLVKRKIKNDKNS